MQKIISLFQRNYGGDRLVRDEIVPGAEWVQAGEGVATRKWDGTSCLVENGALYRRYDAKHGKTPPVDFRPAQEPDPIAGHWPGWIPVRADDPASQWHREAFMAYDAALPDATYELIGPKVQGNPYKIDTHMLVCHGVDVLLAAPRTFDALKEYFAHTPIEGIVWHHPDGRMVKIKRRDFGFAWPEK